MKQPRITILGVLSALAVLVSALGATPARAAERALTLENFREFAVFEQTIDIENINYPLLEAAVFLVTNEQRLAHGLKPVGFHPLLADAARGHAQRMVRDSFYSHDDPYNPAFATPQHRAREAGIANPALAENIHNYFALQYNGGSVYVLEGRGRFSHTPGGPAIPMHTYLSFADGVVADWMASPGHRANILNPEARQLGIGLRFYWSGNWPHVMAVQNFQFFRDVVEASGARPTPAPTPAPAPEPDYGEPEPDFAEPAPEPDYGEPEPDYREPAPRRGCHGG